MVLRYFSQFATRKPSVFFARPASHHVSAEAGESDMRSASAIGDLKISAPLPLPYQHEHQPHQHYQHTQPNNEPTAFKEWTSRLLNGRLAKFKTLNILRARKMKTDRRVFNTWEEYDDNYDGEEDEDNAQLAFASRMTRRNFECVNMTSDKVQSLTGDGRIPRKPTALQKELCDYTESKMRHRRKLTLSSADYSRFLASSSDSDSLASLDADVHEPEVDRLFLEHLEQEGIESVLVDGFEKVHLPDEVAGYGT